MLTEHRQPERSQTMFRKIIAAILIVTAIGCASAAVPGLLENLAYACPASDPAC